MPDVGHHHTEPVLVGTTRYEAVPIGFVLDPPVNAEYNRSLRTRAEAPDT
jgi:hypothetical protein